MNRNSRSYSSAVAKTELVHSHNDDSCSMHSADTISDLFNDDESMLDIYFSSIRDMVADEGPEVSPIRPRKPASWRGLLLMNRTGGVEDFLLGSDLFDSSSATGDVILLGTHEFSLNRKNHSTEEEIASLSKVHREREAVYSTIKSDSQSGTWKNKCTKTKNRADHKAALSKTPESAPQNSGETLSKTETKTFDLLEFSNSSTAPKNSCPPLRRGRSISISKDAAPEDKVRRRVVSPKSNSFDDIPLSTIPTRGGRRKGAEARVHPPAVPCRGASAHHSGENLYPSLMKARVMVTRHPSRLEEDLVLEAKQSLYDIRQQQLHRTDSLASSSYHSCDSSDVSSLGMSSGRTYRQRSNSAGNYRQAYFPCVDAVLFGNTPHSLSSGEHKEDTVPKRPLRHRSLSPVDRQL